jgi:hypothetical protein
MLGATQFIGDFIKQSIRPRSRSCYQDIAAEPAVVRQRINLIELTTALASWSNNEVRRNGP